MRSPAAPANTQPALANAEKMLSDVRMAARSQSTQNALDAAYAPNTAALGLLRLLMRAQKMANRSVWPINVNTAGVIVIVPVYQSAPQAL